jgi:hypothetical protein
MSDAAESESAMTITLERQVVSEHCPECDANFSVVRGSVYADGEPLALYLVALHGHSPAGRLSHLAIAIRSQPRPVAAFIEAIALPQEIAFSLVDSASSPWGNEAYLGQMLGPDEVRSSPHRATFFHIAEHIVHDLPEAAAYLA